MGIELRVEYSKLDNEWSDSENIRVTDIRAPKNNATLLKYYKCMKTPNMDICL